MCGSRFLPIEKSNEKQPVSLDGAGCFVLDSNNSTPAFFLSVSHILPKGVFSEDMGDMPWNN